MGRPGLGTTGSGRLVSVPPHSRSPPAPARQLGFQPLAREPRVLRGAALSRGECSRLRWTGRGAKFGDGQESTQKAGPHSGGAPLSPAGVWECSVLWEARERGRQEHPALGKPGGLVPRDPPPPPTPVSWQVILLSLVGWSPSPRVSGWQGQLWALPSRNPLSLGSPVPSTHSGCPPRLPLGPGLLGGSRTGGRKHRPPHSPHGHPRVGGTTFSRPLAAGQALGWGQEWSVWPQWSAGFGGPG